VIGVATILVGLGFLSPGGLAVILGHFGVAEHLGGIGGLTLGPSGALVRGGGPSVSPTPALDLFVALMRVVIGHTTRLPLALVEPGPLDGR
jgi:hypothetical protein